MSTQLVRDQITKFLKTDTPEVLCIRGNWGTGKTYNWQTTIKGLREDQTAVALNQYAYVSLFGVSSINQIKASILQNTVTRDKIGDLIMSVNIREALSKGEKGLKATFLKLLPLGGDGLYDVAVSALSALSTKQIICFDDLERKAAGISAGDVLGFISYLKEERACKVALLLNDEALEGEDREQFTSYLEKVVDINLRFAPSAAESADIALEPIDGSVELKPVVRERAIQLDIDNVRVIRKIFRLVLLVEPLLKGYEKGVLKSVVSSLVLFGWCHYQPELAPPLVYVKRKGAYDDIRPNQEKVDPTKERWEQILRDYGYGHTDGFDLVLMQGVVDGYFKSEDVDLHASELNLREKTGKARSRLGAAWDNYHHSFRNNEREVLDPLFECFMDDIQFYTLGNLIALIDLFRALGDLKGANEMFDRYVEVKKGKPGAFDPSALYDFGGEIPKDLQKRLKELDTEEKPDHSVEEMLLALKDDGFHSQIAEKLARTPVKEYVRVLTTVEGEDLSTIRRGLTAYLNVVNPNDAAIEIMDRAGEALTQIAAASPLNAMRANTWGLIRRLENKSRTSSQMSKMPAAEAAAPAEPSPQTPSGTEA